MWVKVYIMDLLTLVQIIHLYRQFRWPFCERIAWWSFFPADALFWRSDWREWLRFFFPNNVMKEKNLCGLQIYCNQIFAHLVEIRWRFYFLQVTLLIYFFSFNDRDFKILPMWWNRFDTHVTNTNLLNLVK